LFCPPRRSRKSTLEKTGKEIKKRIGKTGKRGKKIKRKRRWWSDLKEEEQRKKSLACPEKNEKNAITTGGEDNTKNQRVAKQIRARSLGEGIG